MLTLSDYQYDLPAELIATHPADQRDRSRLMQVPLDGSAFTHHAFADLPGLLRPGDCLVLNDSRVIPARLNLQRPTGGACEVLLLHPLEGGAWEAMVRPARKLRAGDRLALPGQAGDLEILGGEGRTRSVRFELAAGLSLDDFLERHGELPLPPYILHQRKAQSEPLYQPREDTQRYQTVFAQPPGSVAAPTAGLHFTPELLAELTARGVEICKVTLHVGAGTFEPVMTENVTEHPMHFERFEIGAQAAGAIEAARIDPARRVVAVGTTSVRTLEACMKQHGRICSASGQTDLFIYPGFQFQAVRAMITNFHLPGSTLIMLVAALCGRERILAAYGEAIAQRYRFYSYGDAMLIQ